MYSALSNQYLYESEHSRFDKIISIMKNNWLYANDYEDVEKVLEDNAYYGMLTFEDDPYTTYMSSDELNSFQTNINLDYVGIGVMYTNYNDVAEIERVYKNSPAEIAGIHVGDIIVQVDDVRITAETIDDLKSYVVGEEGTVVLIKVLRDGKETSFPVTRAAVDSTTYGYETYDYAYLEISSFGEGTGKDVEEYLKSFTNKKLIIDLRNDTGGYQTAVQEIAGYFIGPEEIYMKQEYNNGAKVSDATSKKATKYEFDKIVILTNGITASAAEVLTICLKEQLDNVTLVGETTFGKGVVQSTQMIENNSAIKYTSSRWLSPVNEVWINGEGIKPDIEVFQDEVLYLTVYPMLEDMVYHYDDCGSDISFIESCLDYLGYDVDREDGYLSRKVMDAIVQFKIDHGMEPTEELDESTYQAIYSATSYENSINSKKDYQMQKAIEVIKKKKKKDYLLH